MSIMWKRALKSDVASSASDEVDEALVIKYLQKRDEAKLAKNYEKADKYAAKLQGMNVCYSDSLKEWNTRVRRVDSNSSSSNVLDDKNKKQLRNRRQAAKNRRKAKELKAEGAGSEGDSVSTTTASNSGSNENSDISKRKSSNEVADAIQDDPKPLKKKSKKSLV